MRQQQNHCNANDSITWNPCPTTASKTIERSSNNKERGTVVLVMREPPAAGCAWLDCVPEMTRTEQAIILTVTRCSALTPPLDQAYQACCLALLGSSNPCQFHGAWAPTCQMAMHNKKVLAYGVHLPYLTVLHQLLGSQKCLSIKHQALKAGQTHVVDVLSCCINGVCSSASPTCLSLCYENPRWLFPSVPW